VSFCHVAPRRGAKRLPEHGHKAGNAVVAEVGGNLLERPTVCHPFHCKRDGELSAPPAETHTRLPVQQSFESSLAKGPPPRPNLQVRSISWRRDHRIAGLNESDEAFEVHCSRRP
jgi:hypothetical protein